MEIKITNTAPGEYHSEVSFSGSVDDVIKETVLSADRYTMVSRIFGKGGKEI